MGWPARTIHWECAISQAVVCESSRLSQLLSNLLANALTHGAKHSATWAHDSGSL